MPASTLKKLLNTAGGGAVALTLMACYGGPPRDWVDSPTTPSPNCTDASQDIDKDGVCAGDCDEVNAQVYPGASDPPGDGLDQNCDGADGIAGQQPPAPVMQPVEQPTTPAPETTVAAPP